MTIDVERLAVDADYWDEVAPEGASHLIDNELFVKWIHGFEYQADIDNPDNGWQEADISWTIEKYKRAESDGDFDILDRPTQRAEPKSHPTDTQPAESVAQISAEWDITGLPHAGCECEVEHYRHGWVKAIVIGVDDKEMTLVCRTHWGYDGFSNFRQIPSPADQARDAAIDHAFSKLTDDYVEARQVLGDLYDAGLLRKPEKP